MNAEFRVHKLNDDGMAKAVEIAELFDVLLVALAKICPSGREFSLVRTKLEEACFFTKKSMAGRDVFLER